MSLSNTAVPKYYGMFRDKVLRGKIPVCREISMEMNRIDSLIEREDIYYDDQAIDGFIKFCENEMTLTDGSDVVLLDSFKLWAEQALSWFYFVQKSVWIPDDVHGGGRWVYKRVKKRLITKQYLIVGRGAAKSMYDSFMQAYFLIIDGATTHQITTAPTMKLAEEVMMTIRTSITRAKGPLFKFLTQGSINNTSGHRATRQKLCSTKKGIENLLTGSLLEVRAMSIDKLQGLRVKIATLDEWLSGVLKEDPIAAIEQGASKNDNYLIIATSSEGTVRNGAGDSIKMELMDILQGKYYNPHVSIFYYRLDDVEEVADPGTWVKANPNLGYTVSYEAYQNDVERAENVPEARNEILAKRFGIPMEGFTYFFAYEWLHLARSERDYHGMECSLGIDLSLGDDFCAFTFLFPLSTGEYGIKTRSYITEVTYNNLIKSLKFKYNEFIDEGSLIIMESTILNMMDVYDELTKYIEDNEYLVNSVGYDPYNATAFMQRWRAEYGEYGVEIVRQGRQTESVPLGEIRKLVQEDKMVYDQDLMLFCMRNAATLTDSNGNRKLIKNRSEQKIDSVSALMDAFVAYKNHVDIFA